MMKIQNKEDSLYLMKNYLEKIIYNNKELIILQKIH